MLRKRLLSPRCCYSLARDKSSGFVSVCCLFSHVASLLSQLPEALRTHIEALGNLSSLPTDLRSECPFSERKINHARLGLPVQMK